jgi:hypothetical protein
MKKNRLCRGPDVIEKVALLTPRHVVGSGFARELGWRQTWASLCVLLR